jgi:hypothetical protein
MVRCQIRRGTTIVYAVTDTLYNLGPGQQDWIDFEPQYTPTLTGTYKVTFSAILSGDQNNSNNSKITELDVYELPSELRYCDNIAETGSNLIGNNMGYGVEFGVPEVITVQRAGFYINESFADGPAYIWVLLNDAFGQPDVNNPIAGDTVMVTDTGWVDVDFPSPNNLVFDVNEKFYMVAVHAYANTFAFGIDQSSPMSNRGWEYSVGMHPDRERLINDVMFKIYADTSTFVYCSSIVGDINDDHEVNALDITAGVNYFRGGEIPTASCYCGASGDVRVSGDVNGTCIFNGIDVTYYVNYLKGGPGLRACPTCHFAP